MTRIKGYFSMLLFFMLFMTHLSTLLVHALPDLNITVNTSDYTYWITDNVDIYGNLTRDDQPVDGLVGLEVKNPSGDTVVIRTLQTGTNPPGHNITVTQIIPMDRSYQPKDQFYKGEVAYFLVFVNKTSPEPQVVLVTLSVYDATNVPLGITCANWIQGQDEMAWHTNFQIPMWASAGTARVYVGVYTDWPSAGGTPLCPEKSESITIYDYGGGGYSAGVQSSGSSQSAGGTYSFSFTTSRRAERGLHTVYVSSSYQGEQATNTTTFLVNIPDINGDGFVNLDDLELLSAAWLSESGQPKYNADADFNEDGFINLDDLEILSFCWLYEPP